jgi:hypothetical protein
MVDLRKLSEEFLATSLEGDFSLPVEIQTPNGAVQTVRAQVLYDRTGEDPQTGETVYVTEPVVVVRRSSLDPLPSPGDRLVVRIPSEPREDADLETYFCFDQSYQGGRSLGMLRLYLTKTEQTPA